MPSFKVCFIGDSSVGKTSIISRMRGYDEDSVLVVTPTIGVDNYPINVNVDGTDVELKVFDTAGQERFHHILPNSLRDASIIIVVFSFCEESSFQNVEDWVRKARDIVSQECVFYLVGNKTDVSTDSISDDAINKLVNEIHFEKAFKTSALLNDNINELTQEIAQKCLSLKASPELCTVHPINIDKKEKFEINCNC